MKLYKFLATIYCDFNENWCNFAQTSNCDDKSKHGFIWERSTPDNIKDRGIEGPDKGWLTTKFIPKQNVNSTSFISQINTIYRIFIRV